MLDPGDVIINTPPTFGMYAFDCAVNGGGGVARWLRFFYFSLFSSFGDATAYVLRVSPRRRRFHLFSVEHVEQHKKQKHENPSSLRVMYLSRCDSPRLE